MELVFWKKLVSVYNGTPYVYDAWGSVNVSNPSMIWGAPIHPVGHANPIRYRGYYYDVETDWYFLQTRYYNPEWKRFINADTYFIANGDALNGSNMYAYCRNNPVMRVDPSGMQDAGVLNPPSSGPTDPFIFLYYLVKGIGALAAIGTTAYGLTKTANDIINFLKVGHIDWDLKKAQRVHILKGSKDTPHDWSPFGIDPDGKGAWTTLLAILKKVIESPDHRVGEPETVRNGQIWLYELDFIDKGVTVIVKIFESVKGWFKLSDAFTRPL